ncbi:MAG: peptide-methionine (R)-S-oxide reductase MsrB [Gammaproteobacteria bacterium]|nr:peptide-methionine (R)-S-oxide reductase MsrB [Gammaproteobacteria bacterium]MCP5137800.1 peptide-methionine (R)-S-oxide reductase MsrB [Gammaproteobacteria bacterium]
MVDKVEKSEAEWREELSDEQFWVCRQKGTEPAFTGVYHDCKEDGLYRCSACGNALFMSDHKYDSGSGWPSFWEPVTPDAVKTQTDGSHGMIRTEVLCGACGSHLGHLFNDGPRDKTGLRYCINSVSLDLDKE